jgi:hypothetical protein
VFYFELTVERRLKHASPLRIVPRNRCRTPLAQVPRAHRKAALSLPQKLKKVGSSSFLVIYIQLGLHSIVVCGGLLLCLFQVAQYF